MNGFSQQVTSWISFYPLSFSGIKTALKDSKGCFYKRVTWSSWKHFKFSCIEPKEYQQPWIKGMSADRRKK